MNLLKLKTFSRLWIIYALLTFPLFYFAYKYGTPDLGLRDFYDYYKLYSNWDIEHTDAPFNMRLVSSFFVYLFNKIGFHYDTATSFDKIQLSKQVFFNAIFFNYLCVTTTCVILYQIVKKHFSDILLAFISGLVYLLGFGTLFYEIMPITDAFSVMIFSLVLYGYLSKKYIIILPLVILILQREYIFLALGLVCVLDYWKYREGYYLRILLVCIACFGIYYVLRKTLLYTPKYDRQASPGYFLDSITHLKFPLLPYIKQTLMTLNLFILYIGVIVWKKFRKVEIDGFGLLKLVLLFAQINFISFAAVFGNNTGRYFYILVPLVIYELIKEVKPLIKQPA